MNAFSSGGRLFVAYSTTAMAAATAAAAAAAAAAVKLRLQCTIQPECR